MLFQFEVPREGINRQCALDRPAGVIGLIHRGSEHRIHSIAEDFYNRSLMHENHVGDTVQIRIQEAYNGSWRGCLHEGRKVR